MQNNLTAIVADQGKIQVRQSILFSFHNIRAIADPLRPNPISDLNKNAINPDLLRPTANLQNSLVQESIQH